MSNPKVQKLAIKLRDGTLALRLVQAGLDSPAKIRRATNAELRKVDGVGPVAVKAIRRRLPRRA